MAVAEKFQISNGFMTLCLVCFRSKIDLRRLGQLISGGFCIENFTFSQTRTVFKSLYHY